MFRLVWNAFSNQVLELFLLFTDQSKVNYIVNIEFLIFFNSIYMYFLIYKSVLSQQPYNLQYMFWGCSVKLLFLKQQTIAITGLMYS